MREITKCNEWISDMKNAKVFSTQILVTKAMELNHRRLVCQILNDVICYSVENSVM